MFLAAVFLLTIFWLLMFLTIIIASCMQTTRIPSVCLSLSCSIVPSFSVVCWCVNITFFPLNITLSLEKHSFPLNSSLFLFLCYQCHIIYSSWKGRICCAAFSLVLLFYWSGQEHVAAQGVRRRPLKRQGAVWISRGMMSLNSIFSTWAVLFLFVECNGVVLSAFCRMHCEEVPSTCSIWTVRLCGNCKACH